MSKKEIGDKKTGSRETARKGIRTEKIVSTGDAIKYLEEIAGCLKKGKLVVTQGDECFVLTLPETDTVKLKIDVKQKKEKGKIEISMTWQELSEMGAGEDLILSATEPAAPKAQPKTVAAQKVQAGPKAADNHRKPKGKKPVAAGVRP